MDMDRRMDRGTVCCAAHHGHPWGYSFVAKAVRISRDAHLDGNVQRNVRGKMSCDVFCACISCIRCRMYAVGYIRLVRKVNLRE